MKIEHIAVWVEDIEQLKAFYATYFGATAGNRYTNPRTQFSSYFLTFSSGARLEIMQRPTIEPLPDKTSEWHGYAHFAFSVGSRAAVDALTERLTAAGYPCISAPRTTGDGYYESVILDPEGNRIEITV